MGNRLLCGAGKAGITPPSELLDNLRGLGDRRFSHTIIDEIYVRAIALSCGAETALIISAELDKVPYPQENAEEISRRTGVPAENILLFAVHTHCAPVCGERPTEKINNQRLKSKEVAEATGKYEEFFTNAAASAACDAVASLRPCKMGWSTGESYINVNRLQDYVVYSETGERQLNMSLGVNPKAEVSREVFAMRFNDLDGGTIATFVNYPVHCCVAIGNKDETDGGVGMTGDISGRVSAMLEKSFGGVAIWSSGAAGDVNPVMLNEYNYPDPETGMVSTFSVEGNATAKAMLTLLSTRHFADVSEVVRGIECGEFDGGLRVRTDWASIPGKDAGSGGDTEPEPYKVRLRMLRLGDLAFLGVSGELFSSFVEPIRSAVSAEHLCVINHESSLVSQAGYIYDDETLNRWDRNGPGNILPGIDGCRITPGYLKRVLPETAARLF